METVLKNSLSEKGHCELTKTCVPKQEQALCKKTINNVISVMYINAGNLKEAKA